MQISKSDTIAGLPALETRAILQRAGRLNNDRVFIAEDLEIEDALSFCLRCEAEGLIERVDPSCVISIRPDTQSVIWRRTLLGNALVLARTGPRIKRTTADRALGELLHRVDRLNAEPDIAHCVTRVIVFGSYLGDADRIGDLDIAVETQGQWESTEEFYQLRDASLNAARQSGRRFREFIDEARWPREEVRLYLSARSRTLSFTTPDDGILHLTRTLVVFDAEHPLSVEAEQIQAKALAAAGAYKAPAVRPHQFTSASRLMP